MSTLSMARPTTKSKTFVAPTLTDFDLGCVAYRMGRKLESCTNDEQRRGWLKSEWTGEDNYWRCMMAQASDVEVAL